jgi:hypothetical protein
MNTDKQWTIIVTDDRTSNPNTEIEIGRFPTRVAAEQARDKRLNEHQTFKRYKEISDGWDRGFGRVW